MPPTRMTEISTIYQPQTRSHPYDEDNQLASATAIETPLPSVDPTAATTGSIQRRRRSPPNTQSRGFQIRHGAFKLNQLRLPSTASRFIIMQVILSCICAVLGILAVAFHCWMAYMCIPVIVGALELFVGIMGYTAIKRPHKRCLIKTYFSGCLIGSLAGLGLVVFSIIGATMEQEYECTLLPGVLAHCNVVRGARFTIELTTVVVGTGVIVVTQVMFMFMCYGCCSRTQMDDQRSRSRASNSNQTEDIPANLDLPSYDEHHNYPASPYHDGSFFVNSVSGQGFEPPSYTNIGLITDEVPGGITPLAAALGGLPLEPPPPYTLYAPSLQSTPVVPRSFMGSPTSTTPSSGPGGAPSQNALGNVSLTSNSEIAQGVLRDVGGRGSRRSVQGYSAAIGGGYQHQIGLRDRTIHQSLRLNSEQSGEWNTRSAHQRQINVERSQQSESTMTDDDDPNSLPPELYRDQIRRSGHRYSLSDPTLFGRNTRNARQRPRPPPDTTQSQTQDGFSDFAINVDDGTIDDTETFVVSYQTETEAYGNPSTADHVHDQRVEDSPRRRRPPPYEGRHNVVRTHASTPSRTSDVTYPERNRERSQEMDVREDSSQDQTTQLDNRIGVQADVHQARTLPSNWRPELVEEAIYESIPSLQSSPSNEERNVSPERRQFQSSRARHSTSAAEDSGPERSGPQRNGRGRTGSRSWDERASQERGLPDVIGYRDSSIEPMQDRGRDLESERGVRTQSGRQPPPYGGRRIPAYAPPPYRARNRSLPNYARRQNLTSPPPPYHGASSQRNANRAEPHNLDTEHGNIDESTDRLHHGCTVRDTSELSDRLGHEEPSSETEASTENEHREERDCRTVSPGEREGYRRVSAFHGNHPQPTISHSLPRLSLSSSLTMPPPSSTSSMRHPSPVSPTGSSTPSAFRQYPTSSTSSSSSVTLQSPRQPSVVASATSSPSSSSNAVSPKRARADLLARISGPASSRPPPRVPSSASSSSMYSRSFQAVAVSRNEQNSRPARSVTSFHSAPSAPIQTQPQRSTRSVARPPSHNQVSPHPNVPLHPLSLPAATMQQHHPSDSRSTKVETQRSRTDGKPAAEIHPFRTVHSQPVKAQRAYMATIALANALQKGQLNDLLEEYEETII